MKKFFSMMALILAMACTTLAFNSCNNDDDTPATPAAAEVAGTYTGNGTMTVMGQSFDYPNVAYTLTAKDETTLTLTIPATGEGSMKFPDLKVENISVKKASDGTYQLGETEYNGSVTVDGATKNYTVTVANSTISGSTLKLNYSLQYGSMPMAMVTTFEGTKTK